MSTSFEHRTNGAMPPLEELVARIRTNVPAELLEWPVWLLWELERLPGEKPKKVPLYATGERRNGTMDGPADREALVTFEEAAAALVRRQRASGLGIALGPLGDDVVLSGLDFDHCLNGSLDPRVEQIMGAAGSYAEKSVSGDGVHILGLGDIGTLKKDDRGIEIYSGKRFFVVTGERLNRAGLEELSAAALLARKLYGTGDVKPNGAAASAVKHREPCVFDNLPVEAIERELAHGTGPAGYADWLHETAALRTRLESLGIDSSARYDDWHAWSARSPGHKSCGMCSSVWNGWDRAKAPIEGAPADWSTPVNLLAEIAAPPLPTDALPAPIGEFASAYAAATGFDPALTLSAAVVAAAAALDDKFQIVADSATRRFQAPRLWVLAIGKSGAGKSPAQHEMLAPLWDLQHERVEAWTQAVAESPGDAEPPKPRLIVRDTTIEALSEALRSNPRGLLVANDEFEAWLGSLDRYRSGGPSADRAEWMRTFEGGPHTIERIKRGSVFIENWGVSILSATTPSVLAKLAKHLPEDGLMQRFLPIVARLRIEPSPVPELPEMRKRYVETIRRLFMARPGARNGCADMTPDARAFFRQFERDTQLLHEAFDNVPTLESHFAKYPTFLLRLALVFHAIDRVSVENQYGRDIAALPVERGSIEQAARLLRGVQRHALAIYLNGNGSDAYQVARALARFVLATGRVTMERRDMIQRVHEFRKAPEWLQAAALRLLEDFSWLRPAAGGYRKDVATRFDTNPALAQTFGALAEREREKRAVARGLIAESADARRAGLGS